MNRKLNFKKHVQNRIASANRVLHSINRLQNSEWGLKSNAGRQIYQTCISSISDYGAEIWYNAQNSQKSYINQLQKLQNSTLRKFLEFFRIASIDALKTESDVSSIEIRMHRKMQKYALHTMKMTENHPIRICTPISYPSKYQSGIFDENFIQWDKNGKKHASQINRILNTMAPHVNQINIENNEIWTKPWKEMKHWPELKIDQIENLSIENSSNKLDKKLKIKMQVEKHADLLKSIFKINNSMIFYIDKAKNSKTTDVAIVQFFNAKTKLKKLKFRQIYRYHRCGVICNRKSDRILRKQSIFNENSFRYLNFLSILLIRLHD